MIPEIRDAICDMGYEDAVVFDNPDYDSAIIGVSPNGQVIYDFDLMVEELVCTDKMSPEDAVDFICYNTIRALDYMESGPIVMYRLGWDYDERMDKLNESIE